MKSPRRLLARPQFVASYPNPILGKSPAHLARFLLNLRLNYQTRHTQIPLSPPFKKGIWGRIYPKVGASDRIHPHAAYRLEHWDDGVLVQLYDLFATDPHFRHGRKLDIELLRNALHLQHGVIPDLPLGLQGCYS